MKTNKLSLPIKSLLGEVKQIGTMPFGMMAMDPDGKGHYRVGTGGVTYNFRLGDSCMHITGENVQPGVSTKYSGAPGPSSSPFGSPESMAYGIYACVGNQVTIASGPLIGNIGYVTGKISGFGVTVDFNKEIISQMHGDEHFYIKACGVGLSLDNYEESVAIHNLDPELLEKLGIEEVNGRLQIPVRKIIPGYLVGAGVGGSVIASCAQIMTDHSECDNEFNLSELCFGDIIAITDLDTTSGRTFLEGAVTIGIIVSSDSISLGAGPGVMTILASKTSILEPVLSPTANLKNLLPID